MIVSHKHRYIFIKTRKTAGTSIEIALSENCGPIDIITPLAEIDETLRSNLGYRGPQNHELKNKGILDSIKVLFGIKNFHYNHSSAHKIKKNIGKEDFTNYLKFCVVRNPWDRVVSLYYWRIKNSEFYKIDKNITFSKFVEITSSEILSDKHIYTIDDKSAVDIFIRYENLEQELDDVLSKLRMPKARLPNAKSGTRVSKEHYSTLYDEGSLKKINQVCAWEIKQFNYIFEDYRNSI